MDSGKSSCCRTLLNYAVDGGWNPTFVDVDAGQQGLALPGSIGKHQDWVSRTVLAGWRKSSSYAANS